MKQIITVFFTILFAYSYSGTIVVTNTNDSGAGSLRAAVTSASPGDIIRFSPSIIAGGSDTLSLLTNISTTKNLTIKGVYNSTDTLFITSANYQGFLNLDLSTSSTKTFHIDSIVAIDGFHNNGSVVSYRFCKLFIDNCVIKNNTSSFYGGAIYEHFTSTYGIQVNNSKFINNQCSKGGAIYTDFATVTNSEFSRNTGTGGASAIQSRNFIHESNNLFYANNGTALSCGIFTSSNSLYSSNFGTGIYFGNGVINNTNFINNKGLAVDASQFSVVCKLKINNCNFIRNSSGIHVYGDTLIVTNSNFYGNNSGATKFSSQITGYVKYDNCIFQNNKPPRNSGVVVSSGSNTNTYISNSSVSYSQGIGLYCYANSQGLTTFVDKCTFYKNTGSAIKMENENNGFTLNLSNSTIYKNLSSSSISTRGRVFAHLNLESNILIGGFYHQFQDSTSSLGYNIFSNTAYTWADTTDQLGKDSADINLGPFQNNGGYAYTLQPQIPSIAINTGNPLDFSNAQNRPIIGRRDAGAAEYSCQYLFAPDSGYTCNTYYYWQNNQYDSTDTYRVVKIDSICDTVRTLSLTIHPIYDTTSISSCNPIYSPFSGKLYNKTGVYSDTTPSTPLGCDTIYWLTINIQRTFDTIFLSQCGPYSPPFSSKIFNRTGIYIDTTTNQAGCDSIITFNLIVLQNYDTITINSCSTYTSPTGNIYTSNATFNDTLVNRFGCDSIVTISLVIGGYHTVYQQKHLCSTSYYRFPGGSYKRADLINTMYDTINYISSCDTIWAFDFTKGNNTYITIPRIDTCSIYTLPSGKVAFQSGGYRDVITNSQGCDSVMTFNLNYSSMPSKRLWVNGCGSYISPYSGKTYLASGNYTDTIIYSTTQCDTSLILTISLNNSYESISINQCGDYIPPSGSTAYSVSGIYSDTIANSSGCDSIITINYTKNNTIYGSGILKETPTTWKATKNGATSYQWLDCDNGYAIVPGATNQTYTLTSNGSYSVEVVVGFCKDTTICQNLRNLDVSENSQNEFKIYPNPTSGNFTIELTGDELIQELSLIDIQGRIIEYSIRKENNYYTIVFEGDAGIYLLDIKTSAGKLSRIKLIKT